MTYNPHYKRKLPSPVVYMQCARKARKHANMVHYMQPHNLPVSVVARRVRMAYRNKLDHLIQQAQGRV